ncbi:transporter substrate-binding domain-containing protein [Planomonospora sp. ID91781]|uniref:Amino acid ABC transporter/signal transduction systems periplasmic component-like protein n=1 Tax=Planomonospora sphaerica TaxID=161355 RepID=A0A161LJR9_9ACTN|nr:MULTISPECIES: transporter substrate-binding domain-containing protein [Planomonospora]MBG0821653.1 transporter substrate-binding domain-containing protein [Planomonospora sp. ID91781]GAT66765.1 amino acid ABC transporter/signal transduction systems periplasmic component-like protein [Planomonospora sphaerica]
MRIRRTKPEPDPGAGQAAGPPPPVEPPEPDPAGRPGPGDVLPGGRGLRLAGWLAAVMAAVVVAGWAVWETGPPTEAELLEQAGLNGRRSLLVGVKDDTPGIALRKPDGTYEGFDIQIALMIAADLGFRASEVEFLSIETEDRARMTARNAAGQHVKVDLVVATFSVTPARSANRAIGFSAPYLETQQSVITRKGHPDITSLTQLRGKKVCTLAASTSETEIDRAGAEVTRKNRISDCVTGLKTKEYEAVTTDTAILAGFVAEEPGLLEHHDIGLETSEQWAVNAGANGALRTLVDLSLHRSATDPQDMRWEEAYERFVTPMQAHNPREQIAGRTQPAVPEPDVRRWPWERGIPQRNAG